MSEVPFVEEQVKEVDVDPGSNEEAERVLGCKITIGGTQKFPPIPITTDRATDGDAGQNRANIDGLMEAYDKVVKETKVRVGTLLKTDNVSFLIGAGCSMAAGGESLATIPISVEQSLLAKQTDAVVPDWLSLFYRVVSAMPDQTPVTADERRATLAAGNPPPIPINLERLLTFLCALAASTEYGAAQLSTPDGQGIVGESLRDLVANLNQALAEACNLSVEGDRKRFLPHLEMVKKLLTRPLNLRRVNLFTLNYDTLLEQAMDAEGVVAVDGFVGTIRRVFRPESYDQDLYFPAQTTEGRVHRLDRVVHLYKLHGSINWHQSEPEWENPYGLYATFYNERADERVLIYPTPLKYSQTLGLPYSELFRRFAMHVVQPQSVLFALGYGFGDDHVNAIIRQALAVPSFTLVVVNPKPDHPFIEELRDRRDERVWIIEGAIGCFADFVSELLPDLREEEIQQKVVQTFKALDPKTLNARGGKNEAEADVE